MIRNIAACVVLAFFLATTNQVSLSRADESASAPPLNVDRAAASVPDGGELVISGSRRFGPLYEAGRPAPPTDDGGWPADWDKRPHLSLDVFGVTREFNDTREYRNSPSAYGDRQYARRGPYESAGYGNGQYGPRNYSSEPYAANRYGGGQSSRDLFSSDSGFALRYGDPVQGSAYGLYPPPLGYPGPAYGPYSPSYGYGAYGGYPPYNGYGPSYGPSYGPGYWGGGSMVAPPGRYGPYFGW